MRANRLVHWRLMRTLGIGVLILSVVHVPLPQADYHNIRHHDGRGEICVYHDHLLRWHPSAGSNDDVELFHWHWFVPAVELGAAGDQATGGDDHGTSPGSRAAVHAHLGDSLEPDWPTEPLIGAESPRPIPGPDSPGKFHPQRGISHYPAPLRRPRLMSIRGDRS